MELKRKIEQIKKDKEQYAAYLSNESTVVLAGPGSGKTTVLTAKIMRLIREEISFPRGLACVTFGTQAAREFKDRLDIFGFQARKHIFLGTMHSFCIAEILSIFAPLYPQYEIPLPLQIIKDSEKKKLFKQVVSDLDFDNLKLKMEEMDKSRKLNIAGTSKVKIEVHDVSLQVAIEYEQRLHDRGYVDFEDIINYSTQLIQNEAYVRSCLEAKFPWILIDEYQDLGKPLHEMILTLSHTTNIKFFVVGDPDQSILSFQGAIPEYLLELRSHSQFKCIELKINYRSNQEIIDASQIALNENKDYKAGTRTGETAIFDFIICQQDMDEQYAAVANVMIPRYQTLGIPLEEIAIVVGKNEEVLDLSRVLQEAKIPYFVPKHTFIRSDIVCWLEDCARWVCDKSSMTLSNLYNFWINLLIIHGKSKGYPEQVLLSKLNLYELLVGSKIKKKNLCEWLQFIISGLELLSLFDGSDRYPDEVENLKSLVDTAQQPIFISYDLKSFTKLGKPHNQVTVSTRHSAKGLEFEAIIILGLEEEQFPNYYAIRNPVRLCEERRVFFVCVSRAKSACCLMRSRFITVRPRNGKAPFQKQPKASQFWDEIYQEFGMEANTLEYSMCVTNENV